MPITIAYIGKSLGDEKRKKAERNLRALLKDLPPAPLFLIKAIGTHFLFQALKDASGYSDYSNRTIELNLQEFARFNYSAEATSPDQRWAFATLKEEVLHYLADHMAFDSSRKWKTAVAEDLKVRNRARDTLCKAQRVYDSGRHEIKISIREYADDISLPDKIRDFLNGEWEPAQEYLIDLLLVRDYLEARRRKPAKIHTMMDEAFPWTYRLALGFEKSLRLEAARIAKGKKRKRRRKLSRRKRKQ